MELEYTLHRRKGYQMIFTQDVRDPDYVPDPIVCSICGETIMPGEEFNKLYDGQIAHTTCLIQDLRNESYFYE